MKVSTAVKQIQSTSNYQLANGSIDSRNSRILRSFLTCPSFDAGDCFDWVSVAGRTTALIEASQYILKVRN